MKVLLVGATGAVGRPLRAMLANTGHDVWATTRHVTGLATMTGPKMHPVQLDVLDRDQTLAVVCQIRPDSVIYQATDLSARNFAANARLRSEGMPNLVDACLAAGVGRLVAQSVAWAYAPGNKPASEEEHLDVTADGPHGRLATVIDALEAQASKLPSWVVLRYGQLYGPGTWYAPDGAIADDARAGKFIAPGGISSFVHVEDAAGAALAALNWPSGIVNIVDDEPAAGDQWSPVFAAHVGAPPPPVGKPLDIDRGAANRHARHDLGWIPHWASWRTGLTAS